MNYYDQGKCVVISTQKRSQNMYEYLPRTLFVNPIYKTQTEMKFDE